MSSSDRVWVLWWEILGFSLDFSFMIESVTADSFLHLALRIPFVSVFILSIHSFTNCRIISVGTKWDASIFSGSSGTNGQTSRLIQKVRALRLLASSRCLDPTLSQGAFFICVRTT